MVADWTVITLSEANVILIDCDHRTPPASEAGYPYIAIPQLRNGRIETATARRITKNDFCEWTKKAKPTANDVALSRRCNPGETAYVEPGMEFALGQNLVLLRADGTKVWPPFLRWLVRGPDWWEQVGKFLNVGAVFDSLKCADVPKFRLKIPPLQEQKAIAHILGALDDKIELNRRMNEALEAMARALFKSWFVDFDPVRMKAEGRRRKAEKRPPTDSLHPSSFTLPPSLLDLFPDSFEDSELGKTPKGWQVKPLGDLLELAYGRALKAEDRQEGLIPVYGSNGAVGWHNERLVKGPGIVVGRKGNPGVVKWIPCDFFPIDTTFYVIPKACCNSLYFLFHALQKHDLASLGADSAVPGLNRNLAYMNEQILPSSPVLKAFDEVVSLYLARAHEVENESQTLAMLRDTLLPKLISGELRVQGRMA